jgi:hypothetical protein
LTKKILVILLILVCILLSGNILLLTKKNVDKSIENIEERYKHSEGENEMQLEDTNSNFRVNQKAENIYRIDANYFLNLKRNMSYSELKERIGEQNHIVNFNSGDWGYNLNKMNWVIVSTPESVPEYNLALSEIDFMVEDEQKAQIKMYSDSSLPKIQSNEKNMKEVVIAGEEATYRYEERDLELAEFINLSKGTSYDNMLKIFGEPNGEIKITGQLYYEVDGKYVVMPKDFKKGSGVGLEEMDVCTAVLYRYRITLKK